ncbi:MAG: 4Fe-4S dicluster domain-containing protein [Coriobacteriaceae bacterium]|nr:4Fe-4S dicluster domain-containing protein [Coriobacteriaceae bacterium]
MTQLGFFFDADACMGCKACVVACKDVHNLPVGYKLRKVVTGEAGGWAIDAASGLPQPVDVFSYSVSYSCMHCANPACRDVCPKGAVSKDAETGIVAIDQELCIGCGACAKACPWHAPAVVPRIDGTRKSWKCDLCRDMLAAGEEPACVAACSMRCLSVCEFGDDEGHRSSMIGEPLLADAPSLSPHFRLKPHRGLAAHPNAQVRIHSMPEEYNND